MNTNVLIENEKKRLDYPFSRLMCLVMFTVWQIGTVYCMGPALYFDSKTTPLQIDVDNGIVLIAAGYLLNILWMIFFPRKYVYAARFSAAVALISGGVALLLPSAHEMLALLLCVQLFSCCFIIGYEVATISFIFSENSAVKHLLQVYPIGYIIIAGLRNDIIHVPFEVFRLGTIIMLVLLIYFYFRLPAGNLPYFARRADGMLLPKRLYGGVYAMALPACLIGAISPVVAALVVNGISLMYIFAAIAGLILCFVYKRYRFHPLKAVSLLIMLGVIGFLMLFVSLYIPGMALPACALLGIGLVSCALLPLSGVVLVRQYPSRFVPAIIMIFAGAACLVSSAIFGMFREDVHLLYLAYLVIIITMAIIYLFLAPYLLSTLNEHIDIKKDDLKLSAALEVLTVRELEISELISRGYSNRDIAKMLFISEHTVKDHTKNIYRKLDIHSRLELAALVNKK